MCHLLLLIIELYHIYKALTTFQQIFLRIYKAKDFMLKMPSITSYHRHFIFYGMYEKTQSVTSGIKICCGLMDAPSVGKGREGRVIVII